MKKCDDVTLKPEEKALLKKIVSRGKEKARTIARSRVLLMSDDGLSDTSILRALNLARNTVRHVRHRYVIDGLDAAIHEKFRSGAPVKIDGRQRAKITALACSNPPEGRARWTLRLLADRVVELNITDEISHLQVGRILKKTKSNPT